MTLNAHSGRAIVRTRISTLLDATRRHSTLLDSIQLHSTQLYSTLLDSTSSCAGCRSAWPSARRRSTVGAASELSAWGSDGVGGRAEAGASNMMHGQCESQCSRVVSSEKTDGEESSPESSPTLLLALTQTGRAIKFGEVLQTVARL